MSFYICEQPIEGSNQYFGCNLDDISTFSYMTTSNGIPSILIRMKDGSSIQIPGRDAFKILYAMGVLAPRPQN